VRELLVKNGLAGMESSANKLRMTAINAPANPVWPLSPVVATDGEFFYLSTHADYVKTLSDAKGPGLRSTEEYKALAKGLPETGNGCLFVSERLTKTFLDIGQAAQENSGGAAMGSPAFKEFFRMKGDQISGSLSVRVNRPDGVLWVGRSSSSPAQTVPALAVAPLAIMAGIAVPNYFEAQTRAKVARTHSDMRSMATALEAFMIDSNSYPVSSSDPSQNLIGRLADQNPTLRSQTTFKIYQPGSRSLSLTTPIAYMTSVPTDVFSQGAPICYYNAGDKGWIVWSAGPDSKYSLSAENIASIYDPAVPQPSAKVLVHAYDPTNGTVSAGDLWRVKQ
jgi:Tfp pilus assembly protein PilE